MIIKNKTWLAIVACLVVWLMSAPANAQNLVTNGDFAQSTLSSATGWSESGNASGLGFGVFDGKTAADFANVGTNANLYQSVVTTPSEIYIFAFQIADHGGAPNFISASFGGTNVLTLTNITPSASYTAYSYLVTATTTATIVDFSGFNTPGGIELTGVSVTPVPEPETYALLLAGLGLIGFVFRRKSNLVSARFLR